MHGNLNDLLKYARLFWPGSSFFNNSKYIFLGDYVDRGQWGIEVVIFLFCFKILAPNNFILLRGNHEIRQVQENFTFFAECKSRLTIDCWEMINNCFDCLPIAAIVDDRIFCSHAGIPSSITSIDWLYSVPCPLNDPQMQSSATWELL